MRFCFDDQFCLSKNPLKRLAVGFIQTIPDKETEGSYKISHLSLDLF